MITLIRIFYGVIMKNKKIITALALLLSIISLSSCATASKVSFDDFWNINALTPESIHETLVYDVTFEGDATSYGYKLDYQNGKYTTELQSTTNEQGQDIYLYKTKLEIDVVYTFGTETATLHDLVTTEVTFLPAGNGLRPLLSKKSCVSHTPFASTPTTLDTCYRVYTYDFETVYTETSGTCTLTVGEQKKQNDFEINSSEYNYLDNEQLLLSLRAIPATVSSATFGAYSPFTDSVQKILVGFGAKEEKEFTYTKEGVSVTEKVSCRPVQYRLDGENTGATQSAFIAVTDNPSLNHQRNRILYWETPLAYDMGVLKYSLASMTY